MSLITILGVTLAILACLDFSVNAAELCNGSIILPKLYHNGMVMQADGEVTLWGFTNNPDCPVSLKANCLDPKVGQNSHEVNNQQQEKQSNPKTWQINTSLGSSGTECTLSFSQGNFIVTLDVILGDVWICSGQSNMVIRMDQIENGLEEIQNSRNYTNIRMFQLGLFTSDKEEEDILGGWDNWYSANATDKLAEFSAVCFLTARYLTDLMGDNQRVFGLIQTAWNGTLVESWSSQEVLDGCAVPPFDVPDDQPQYANTVLWNAMVHPLLRHTVKGFLWYQGESNGFHNRDLYRCTFPAMVQDWRRKFSTLEDVAPFGFVQLSTFVFENGVEIRWHQTNDTGFVPNESLPNVFMAVAFDTYDEENNVHPRYKQIIGERLSYAAANIAYNMTEYPINGPFIENLNFLQNHYELIFDQPFTYNNAEISGFYVCCNSTAICDADKGDWIRLPKQAVTVILEERKFILDLSGGCSSSLAFVWEDVPVEVYLGAPIYSDTRFSLPAAPWKMDL